MRVEASKPEQWTVLVACLLVFMAQMATTIYLPSLPAVEHKLGISRSYAALSVYVVHLRTSRLRLRRLYSFEQTSGRQHRNGARSHRRRPAGH
jgi:hypothetical protein